MHSFEIELLIEKHVIKKKKTVTLLLFTHTYFFGL